MISSAFSLVGRQVGRIRITAEAGHGAMSSVYVGLDETLGRQVAVKAVGRGLRVDPEARERFLSEARILSSLAHPGVCQIFDVVEADDCSLLVMELADGRRLSEAIAAGLAPHLRWAIAGQLLDVLQAVHEHDIVHRDLKPDNVMVTDDGTVKVLDFGIASLVAAATEERLARAAAGDDRRTPRETGISGTLRWMSPEQARGEPVTAASDLYSLGLVFQELFTGRAPLEPDLTLPVLLARVAAGETRPVEGLDPELTTLIERMKSVAPGARPSARDAGAQLAAIVDRPRRRRRRALVAAVWLVLSLLSVALAIQSGRAGREAKRAAAARAEAEDLVGFILEDLYGSLEPLGRLDLVAGISERALAYYDRRVDERLAPAELDRHARALTQLCEVLEGQGRLNEAVAAQRRAVEIRRQLVAHEPDRPGQRLALAWALVDLERVLDWQGRRDEARTTLDEAGQIAGALVADPETGERARMVMSAYWDRLGTVRCDEGDLAGCLAAYTAAFELDAALQAADPDLGLRWNLSLSRSRLAELNRVAGRLDVALEHSRAALALAADHPPDDPGWSDLVSDLESGHAAVLLAVGRGDEALALQQRVVAARERAVARDPSNLLARHAQAAARLAVGTSQLELGRVGAARAVLAQALSAAQEVSAGDPADVVYLQEVVAALVAAAAAAVDGGEPRAAAAHLDEAVAVAERLRATDPDSPVWRVTLAGALAARGELDRAQAAAIGARALELVAPVAARSDHPEYRLVWARALVLVGQVEAARAVVAELPAAYGRQRIVRRLCRAAELELPGG